MRNSISFFLSIFFVNALSQELSNWIRIDCGAPTNNFDTNGLLWQTDDNFVKTGEKKQISSDSVVLLDQWKTLRFFKNQNKNCYNLPAPTTDRYFVRAMFHYGNYDGLSNPPTFDIAFDGNQWDTVVTSMNETMYSEVIYTSKGNNISVCLIRTQDMQFPFISMLEAWSLPDRTYPNMTTDVAWIKRYRYNYGATEPIFGYPEDRLNRVWTPMIPAGVDAESADFTSLYYTSVDEPPESAIIDLIEAPGPVTKYSDIYLPFRLPENLYLETLHQVVLYFTEIVDDANLTRSIDLYVTNDKNVHTITPQYRNCTEFTVNVQAYDFLEVDLAPSSDSKLPPLISAIEIYGGIYPSTSGTLQDDLDGLEKIVNSFEQLAGWSGEPCLPSHGQWEWITCYGLEPPRVFTINITGYGLIGPLPDFSQMKNLITIDLSNNCLTGPVPYFLGNLPNLEMLDLRNNFFTGTIPLSIVDNKKLTYYVSGNPNLRYPDEKKTGLIIGLTVPLGIILVILLISLLCYCYGKKSAPRRRQAVDMVKIVPEGSSSEGKPQQENASVTITTDASFEYPSSVSDGHNVAEAPTPATTSSNVDNHEIQGPSAQR